jgi:tRNA1(Val) A37 N6-methylase TrmN6
MNDNNTLHLFAEDETHAARMQAVDELHAATNVYTEDFVIDQILEHIDWPNGSKRLIDTSCGAGGVIVRALTKALSQRAFTDDEIPNMIVGWELHPAACAQARSRVGSVFIAFGRSGAVATRLAEKIIHNRDFLTEAPTVPSFDFVIGNPPYLRAAMVPRLLRDEYSQHVPKYALADLAHAFLDRSHRTLREGGKIGVVVADRLLINSSAGALREALGTTLGIEHVGRLDSSSCFYRPKSRRKGTPARVHPLLLVMSGDGELALGKDPVYPGVDETPYEGLPTLSDLAVVKIGPWLGSDGIFLISGEQAAASKIPPEALVRAVDIDDIEGDGIGPPKRFAIRTRPDTRPCDAIMKHLDSTMHLMAEGGMRGAYWSPPETWHNRDLSQPTLMVPRIAKSPKAIWLPPNNLAVNHNVSIISGDLDLLTRIERALRGDLAAQWLREHAPAIEGGYRTINTRLLRKMPIKLD